MKYVKQFNICFIENIKKEIIIFSIENENRLLIQTATFKFSMTESQFLY